jgi:hypothetical protein
MNKTSSSLHKIWGFHGGNYEEWRLLSSSLKHYPDVKWILLVSEYYRREKEGRCFVTEWYVFPFWKELTAEILCSQFIQNIWWTTAAGFKWKTTSHFTLHNLGTEEFLILLWNYLWRQEKEICPVLCPYSLTWKALVFILNVSHTVCKYEICKECI